MCVSRSLFTCVTPPNSRSRSGHYALWRRGIQHTDPSLDNVMVDRSEKHSGVMNDWDLAFVDGLSKHDGSDRTGTVLFMALDLLTDEYWDGTIERLYRHDLAPERVASL